MERDKRVSTSGVLIIYVRIRPYLFDRAILVRGYEQDKVNQSDRLSTRTQKTRSDSTLCYFSLPPLALLGCYATFIGSFRTTYRFHLEGSSSPRRRFDP
jgi:hypothetical protein